MSDINIDPIKKSAVFSIFGQYYGKKLIRLLDDCCGGQSYLINSLRFIGDDTTTNFQIPKNSHLIFISTDGRVNDPLTEYTYNSTTGIITFVGAPSLNVIILIFYQKI